jgi:ATPase family associated with various cellular activities (AAA)
VTKSKSSEEAPPPVDKPASDLIQLMRQRWPRAALTVAAGQAAWPAVRWAHSRYSNSRVFTVKVTGTDEMYDDVHEWVLGLLPPSNRRALIAYSGRSVLHDEDNCFDLECDDCGDQSRTTSSAELKLRYDGNREQAITVSGHKVKVVVYDSNHASVSGNGNGGSQSYIIKPPEIAFTASSHEGRNAVITELASLVKRRTAAATRKPKFRILGSWGGWDTMDDMPGRPLESVILPEGQLDRILGDLERFLAAESEYVRRGLPWHRGHLYAGEPGTGKTSIARAISGHFHLDLWYLTLSDIKNDSDLLKRVSGISPRSMLLIEDVDVIRQAQKRGDGKSTGKKHHDDDEGGTGGLTLAGILNALDGAGTPHGLITILTSNRPDVLDDAMLRSGRVDLEERFGLATSEQAARLVAHYYDCAAEDVASSPAVKAMDGMRPSDIIELCKRNDGWQSITILDTVEMIGEPGEKENPSHG